jgi:xylan 1,4-beta-xylosidase
MGAPFIFLSFVLLAVCLGVALSSNASNSTVKNTVNFLADLQGKQTEIRTPILNCVGSGHASLTLREDWRQHMRNTKRDIGFKYVRFHGILDDDMSAYLNGHANLYNIFSTLDFLLQQDVRPIVELGFMPELLSSNASQTVFHYEGGIAQPKDWNAFDTFIAEVVSGLVDRYGLEEVRQWRFEVWNEPNCGFYKDGNCCGPDCGDKSAYFELYKNVAAAVKSVDKLLRVGGPATAQLAWIPDFIAFTQENGVPVDFISTHLYPTDPMLPFTADGFMDAIAESAALAATAQLPLVMTEFNSGLGVPGYDGPFSASAVFHYHLSSQNVPNLDTLSFWTFTDVFEEQGLISSPYYEASPKFGMQTLYGVPKPSYRAFEFIAQQPKTAVKVTALPMKADGSGSTAQAEVKRKGGLTIGTVDAMVSTKKGDDLTQVFAIIGNYNMSWQPIDTQFVEMHFAIPSDALVPDFATVERIDSTHAYAMPTWLAAGSPIYPSMKEVNDEMAASLVKAESIALQRLASGAVVIAVELEPYALVRLRFDYKEAKN